MAKRKRLTQPDMRDISGLSSKPAERSPSLDTAGSLRSRAPVADMVGVSSAVSALEELSNDVYRARSEGRMVVDVPLERIDITYLIRDRILLDEEDMETLEASIEARGQQTPLDVVDLGEKGYGLISGLRRLKALQRLRERTGEERFAQALCLVRQPKDSPDAYLAMVEENEIRSGLSFYERAAIASRAAEQGAFPNVGAALRDLFSSASKAKRSKIGSFVTIFEELDAELAYPAAIPERLGLALSQAFATGPDFAPKLARALRAEPDRDALRERKIIEMALRAIKEGEKGGREKPAENRTEAARGIYLEAKRNRIILSGPRVDADLRAKLADWLADQNR